MERRFVVNKSGSHYIVKSRVSGMVYETHMHKWRAVEQCRRMNIEWNDVSKEEGKRLGY